MNRPRTIYISSDWHLGGSTDGNANETGFRPGTQICRSTPEIVSFVDWLTTQIKEDAPQVELVVNGDMVDFLAPDFDYDPVPWQEDEEKAAERFEQIANRARDQDGRGPFEAMKEFLSAGGELTILLGNHDLELSLPLVRRSLANRLESYGKKFTFIYDGEAHVRGRLLIEHGNRYDPFNVVDFSRLRQERSHLSRGLVCTPTDRSDDFFLPPYGSELVANVYNRLLPKVPFLNMLKPENEAAIPLVLALCPESRDAIDAGLFIYRVVRTLLVNRLKDPSRMENAGLLGAANDGPYSSLGQLLESVLGPEQASDFLNGHPSSFGALSTANNSDLLELLKTKGRSLAAGADYVTNLAEIVRPQKDARRLAQVVRALAKVRDDADFSLVNEQPKYANAAEELMCSGQFSVVVFGHTHLAKNQKLPSGTYFNCGTWADILRLPACNLDASDGELKAKQFVTDMIEKNIKPYIYRRLTFVRARVDLDDSVDAELLQFQGIAKPAEPICT